MDQLLDLLAGQLPAAGQLAEHPLPVGPRLLDHLAALLLGHRQLRFGVGRRVAAPAAGLQVGLLTLALGVVGGFPQQPGGALLGPRPDRRGALAGGLQDARRLLAEQPGRRLLVDDGTARRAGYALLRLAQLALEEPLALLQASQLGGHHAQEVAHLLLVEPTTRRAEGGVGHGRRR